METLNQNSYNVGLRKAWHNMIARTTNPDREEFQKHYGVRGITVIDRWMSFAEFAADMGPGYKPGLWLDRVDNDRGYEPSNCRWVTPVQSAYNRSTTRRVKTSIGETCPAHLAKCLDISAQTIRKRLDAGWTVAVVLVPPAAA